MSGDDVLGTILVIVSMGLLFWFLMHRMNTRAKTRLARVESVNRLIEKFSSAREVIEFLETEQGKKLLEDPLPASDNPKNRVLRFIQFGVVLVFVGIAFFANAYHLSAETDINFVRQAMDQRFWGVFALAAGLGLLVVALLVNLLAKKWGLTDGPHNAERG